MFVPKTGTRYLKALLSGQDNYDSQWDQRYLIEKNSSELAPGLDWVYDRAYTQTP